MKSKKYEQLRNFGIRGSFKTTSFKQKMGFSLGPGGGYIEYNAMIISIRLSSLTCIVCNCSISSLVVHIRNIWSQSVHLFTVLSIPSFHPLVVDSHGSRARINILWRFTGPEGWKIEDFKKVRISNMVR